MKNYKTALKTLILASVLSVSSANAGIYVGLAFGEASAGESGTYDMNGKRGTGWKFAGGNDTMFNETFGMEFGWVDLGDMNEPGVADIETEGFYMMGTANHHVNKELNVFAKFGFILSDQDERSADADVADVSNDGTDITFGVGASYDVNSVVQIRGELERYNTEIPITMFNIWIALKF